MAITHAQLWELVITNPLDYAPYGDVERWADEGQDYPDCSAGCPFFVPLRGKVGSDWGVCTNPASHRCGLLTFEHQGCQRAPT